MKNGGVRMKKDNFDLKILRNRVTVTIIAINILIFIALNIVPKISDGLLLYPSVDRVLERPWTLFTVFFSHKKVIHIISNMGLMLFFGSKLERIIKGKNVLLIYIISGVIGSITIVPVGPMIGWEKTVIGASAAVFGIISAYTVLRPNTKLLGSTAKKWLIIMFIGNIFTAIVLPDKPIGSAAHTTGIIAGILYGYLMRNRSLEVNDEVKA